MLASSIPIPADRIAPMATAAASNAKTIAALLLFMAMLFAIATISVASGEPGAGSEASQASASSLAIGGGFWLLVLGGIAVRYLRGARRATAAAARATSDATYSWFLAGKWIVAADAAGAAQPSLSFKLSGKLRQMLLAVPRAQIVEPNRNG